MTGAAMLCVAVGVLPGSLYALLPMAVDYVPYTASHVLAQLQLIFFSAPAFVWLRRAGLYPPELHGVNLDAEWAHRRALPALAGRLHGGWAAAAAHVRARLGRRARRFLVWLFHHHGPRGTLARTWPTGSLVLWVAVLLAMYLAFYYR
jgi:multicomponent Na+:H+ antiporter subunit D